MKSNEIYEDHAQHVQLPDGRRSLKHMSDADVAEYVNRVSAHLANILRQSCSQWLSEVTDPHLVLYRGFYNNEISSRANSFAFTKTVRHDRRPRDSGRDSHNLYNLLIAKCGKKANRSNSAFCSGKSSTASEYGEPYVVFPIGDFHYTWHTFYADWIQHDDVILSKIMRNHGGDSMVNLLTRKSSRDSINAARDVIEKDPESYKPFCQSLRGDDGTLVSAIKSGNEVMLSCDRTLAIHPLWYKYVAGALQGQETQHISSQSRDLLLRDFMSKSKLEFPNRKFKEI